MFCTCQVDGGLRHKPRRGFRKLREPPLAILCVPQARRVAYSCIRLLYKFKNRCRGGNKDTAASTVGSSGKKREGSTWPCTAFSFLRQTQPFIVHWGGTTLGTNNPSVIFMVNFCARPRKNLNVTKDLPFNYCVMFN